MTPSIPAHVFYVWAGYFRDGGNEMPGESLQMGEETTRGVMEGRCAVAVEHVTSLMFSLHVRDRCLEGLTAVARQQSFPFV